MKTIIGLVRSIIINAICPFIIYHFAKNYTSEFFAIVLTSIPSLIDSIVGIIRNKRIDIVAGFVLVALILSLIFIALGGDARLYLVRDSLIAGIFGLAILVSLLFPKSIMYYSLRFTITGNDKQKTSWLNSIWPDARPLHTVVRDLSFIWGIGLILETVVRVPLVYLLSIPQFLIVSPLIQYGFYGLFMLLSMIVGRGVGVFFDQWKKEHAAAEVQQESSNEATPQAS